MQLEDIGIPLLLTLTALFVVPIGRLFGVKGIFSPLIVGLVVVSLPAAAVVNFNAGLALQVLTVGYWFAPIASLTLLATIQRKPVRKPKVLMQAFAFVTAGLILWLTLDTLNQNNFLQYVSDDILYLRYNAHDGYYASAPLELLKADYSSRLRIHNLYPVEWGTYHFMNAVTQAVLLQFVSEPGLSDFYTARFLLSCIGTFAMAEAVLLYQLSHQGEVVNKSATMLLKNWALPVAIKLGFLAFMLLSWFGPSYMWNMTSSGGLSIVAGFLFLHSRLNKDTGTSYIWLAIVAVAVIRNAPAVALALPFIVYLDFGSEIRSVIKKMRRDPGSALKYVATLALRREAAGAALILGIGVAYMLASLGHGEGSLFGMPQLSFSRGWWSVSPFFYAIDNVQAVCCTEHTVKLHEFYHFKNVSWISLTAVVLLLVVQAVFAIKNHPVKTSKSVIVTLSGLFIVSLATLAVMGQVKAAYLYVVLLLPIYVMCISVPFNVGKILLVFAMAHVVNLSTTSAAVGVPAYLVVEFSFLAVMLFFWTAASNTPKKLTFAAFITLMVLGNGPWFSIWDLHQRQLKVKNRYDLTLNVQAAESAVASNSSPDNVYCGTSNYLFDDAAAINSGVRRGWDSEIARTAEHRVVSYRLSKAFVKDARPNLFADRKTDYCK